VTEKLDEQGKVVRHVAVRSIFRWPLGSDYYKIAEDVTRFLANPPLTGAELVIDYGGCGWPFVDTLRRMQPACRVLMPVTITGGADVKYVDGSLHVAKVALVSTLRIALDAQRVKFAEGLPETPTLLSELETYQVKLSPASNELYNAADSAYDDLVISLALLVLQAERGNKVFDIG
jgi:hypothetical protein